MSRSEIFVPDGNRVLVSARDIVQMWIRHSAYDPRYALGTSQHETNFTANEKDTEENGFISKGLYQVSQEEMIHVGMADADPYDPEENTIIFAALTKERGMSILNAVKATTPPSDFNAYLFIAHNQGLAACLKTIKAHGLDWGAYKSRNLAAAQAALTAAQASGDKDAVKAAEAKLQWWYNVFAYGGDCLSGGAKWDDSLTLPAVA